MDERGWDGPLWLGTGNLLARNIGLPVDPEQALAVVLGGVQRPVDAGRVNGTLFLVMAGLGLDAQMLIGASDPLKKRLGWLAYAISVLRHLGDRPITLTISADGGWAHPAAAYGPSWPLPFQFSYLQVALEQEQPWELDGEPMAPARRLLFAAQPGALLLRTPAEPV